MKTEGKQVNVERELTELTAQLLQESGELSRREIRLDASLQRHLGIDSLSRAELFQRVSKKFNVELPDKLLAEAESLNDIAAYVRQAVPGFKSISHMKSFNRMANVSMLSSAAKTLICDAVW